MIHGCKKDKTEDAAGNHLRMHKGLRKCRIYFNHEDTGNHPEKKLIILFLKLYIEYTEYVLDE